LSIESAAGAAGGAARLLGYHTFRALGHPRLLPLNLTVSVTYSCPSRCLTCDIWQKRVDNLTVDEYAKVFRSLGRAPMWVTVSGGDQFLRADLPEIMRLIRHVMRPSVINLPMNGIASKRIEMLLPLIAEHTRGSQLVLNLSIDEIGERHDHLRGAKGNWEKILATYRFARELQKEHPHIVVGVHTVISKFNVERIPAIYAELAALEPDSYLTEIAEQRVELGTTSKDITPSPEQYGQAAGFLVSRLRQRRSRHPVGRLVESLRLEYYQLAQRILTEKRQVIPCFAGWASAHLAPDGHVWGCCVRAESMGNVRDVGHDFRKVWFSREADEFRRSVRANECACPLANAAYTNMLLSPPSMARVAWSYVRR
jgi:MoaA/NifB/PqqE/SkfB family radical SAM enzyme